MTDAVPVTIRVIFTEPCNAEVRGCGMDALVAYSASSQLCGVKKDAGYMNLLLSPRLHRQDVTYWTGTILKHMGELDADLVDPTSALPSVISFMQERAASSASTTPHVTCRWETTIARAHGTTLVASAGFRHWSQCA